MRKRKFGWDHNTGLDAKRPTRCNCHKNGAKWLIRWVYSEEEEILDWIFVQTEINETHKYSVVGSEDINRIHTMLPRIRCSACGKVVPKSSIMPMDSPLVHPGTGKKIVNGFTSGFLGDHSF